MARYEFSEWDTLIGPNNVPILRGYIGTYAYSARTENKNVAIRVWRAGRNSALPLDKVPDYVMAHILRKLAIPA